MPDEKTNSNHELIENYDDVTWLYNWWPMVKSNFRNLLNWVTAHINGTGDRHNAADIDYNSGTVEDGLITLSNVIEIGLSELADADAENCKYTIHQSYDVDISKVGSGNNVLYITIDGVTSYSQMSGKAVAINTGIYQCTFSSPSPVYVNVNGLGNKALRRPLPYDYADYDTKQYYTDKYCYGEIGRHQTLIVYYDGSNFILTNVAVPTKATREIELESTDDSSYATPKAVGVIAGKVKDDIGDLSTLTTTDKSSAVGAINEVNNKKILAGDGQSDTLYKNCLGIPVQYHGTVNNLNHDSLVTIGQHIINFDVPACTGAPDGLSAGSYSGVIEAVTIYSNASADNADVYFNQCKQILTLMNRTTWERYYYQINDEDMTYTEWVNLEDELKSVSSNVQRPVTVFVAASDASAKSKSGADYICTGTNDEETIQDAVDSLPSVGGIVQLSEGTFVFSNNISNATAPQGVELKSNVTFKGSGASTIIDTYSASSTNSNSHIIDVSSCSGITVSDMHIKSGDQKYLTSINIDEAENIRVDNICFSLQGSDSGSLSIGSSSNIKVTNSQFEITESQISISINNNSQNITLKNNVFNVYDWEAIYVYGGASNVIIDGNFFKESYSNTGNSAINVNNALSNVMITNNVIDFPLEPVKVNSAASGKVFVYNNMVKTPPTASAVVQINMDGSSNNWNQTF